MAETAVYPYPIKGFPFRLDYSDFVGSVGPHVHPHTIELQYIIKGRGSFFIQRKRYTFRDNSLLIIPPGAIHGLTISDTKSTDHKICIGILPDALSLGTDHALIRRVTRMPSRKSFVLQFNQADASRMQFLMGEIKKAYDERPAYFRETIESLLTQALVMVSNHQPRKGPQLKPDRAIDAIIALLHREFRRNVGLDTLAQKVHLSPTQLSRKFNAYTGQSLKGYVAALRVQEAQRLMDLDSHAKLIAIALDSGFNDLRTFNRTYKQVTGMTPSQYRKNCLTVRKD